MEKELINEVYYILRDEFKTQHFTVRFGWEIWDNDYGITEELTLRCDRTISKEGCNKLEQLIQRNFGGIIFNIIDWEEFDDPDDDRLIKF